MLKFIVSIALVLFSFFSSFSQRSSSKVPGYYVSVHGDTIRCLVKITVRNFKKSAAYSKDKFLAQVEKGRTIRLLPDSVAMVVFTWDREVYRYSAIGTNDSCRFIMVKSGNGVKGLIEKIRKCRMPIVFGSPSSVSFICLWPHTEMQYYIQPEGGKSVLVTKEQLELLMLAPR